MPTVFRSHPSVLHAALGVLALIAFDPQGSALAASSPAESVPIVTVNPVVLAGAAGGKLLQLRVTAPRDGRRLPILLFSHGALYSKDDYLPLTEYWAAHGYVVIQPTHIESLTLGLPRDDARIREAWRTRALDMRVVLDRLDEIERQAPMLRGRMDRRRVVAAGHSFGGHTAAALVGATMPDEDADLSDTRVLAAVLLAPPGAAPGFRNVAWTGDARPALSIVGMEDVYPGLNDDWRAHTDYYYRSRTDQCLVALAGVAHFLGGTLGINRSEEKTPSAEAVAQVQRLSLIFLDAHARQGKDWVPLRRELLTSRPPLIGAFECR